MVNFTRKLAALLVMASLSPMASASLSWSSVGSTSFTDEYWGDHSPNSQNRDVFGGSPYNVYSIDTTLDSATGDLTVQVNTDFGGQQTGGIQYGDLFFDTQWEPYEDSSGLYKYDSWTTGTDWSYVVHIDDTNDPLANGPDYNGSATIYEITTWNDENGYLSGEDGPLKLSSYRADGRTQDKAEWAVTGDESDGLDDLLATAAWGWGEDECGDPCDYETDDYMVFSFNLSELRDMGVIQEDETTGDFQLAFHWTMSCGNDVIEGVLDFHVEEDTPPGGIPEPASFSLLGIGLIGITAYRRRRARKNGRLPT